MAAKPRVHEIAAELGVDSKFALAKLKELSEFVKSPSSTVEPPVARKLRARLPREIQDSARAAEWLYERAGFGIQARLDQVPWLFFKHARQLEIYSVHLFMARRA